MRLMSSRVAGAFLWAIVGGSASGSPMELKSIDGDRLGAELQFMAPVYKAIGRISYRPTPDVTLEQSGFFIRSDLFMTTISPQQKDPLDCSSIKIYAGSFNFDADPVEANYCDEVVEQDPKFGYAIIRTQRPNPTVLRTSSELDRFLFRHDPSFHSMGFSPFGRLFYAGHCKVVPLECTGCEAAEIDKATWTDGQCLHYQDMIGGPVLTRAYGGLHVAGLLGSLSNPASGNYNISPNMHVVSLAQIERVSEVVGSLTIPPPRCKLEATAQKVAAGDSVTLTLTYEGNVKRGNLNGQAFDRDVGAIDTTVKPTRTTVYGASVSGRGGTVHCHTKIEVEPLPRPSCQLVASRDELEAGDSTEITIVPDGDYTGVSIEGVREGQLEGGKTLKTTPLTSRSFIGRVEGPAGVATCRLAVTVHPTPAPTCDLVAERTRISYGSKTRLKVTTTGRTTGITISGKKVEPKGANTYVEVSPLRTTSYGAYVEGPGGTGECRTTVAVDLPAKPSCTLTASPSSIKAGQEVELYVRTSGFASVVKIDGVPAAVKNGQRIKVKPDASREYRARVSGPGGGASCVAAVTVVE